ncbi:MAG: aminotransferase class IV family protein [Paracoccaceae bacterium]
MESPLRPPAEPDFRLIETFGWHPGEGYRHLALHLDRMERSAQAFGIRFARNAALPRIEVLKPNGPTRCRLTLDTDGGIDLTHAPLGPTAGSWTIAVAAARPDPADPFLRHKTTHRQLYNQNRAALPPEADEVVFVNRNGFVSEGTITNIFIETQNGDRLTPSLANGVLPGILRETLLASGFIEADLTLADLQQAKAVYVGNSLRGLIPTHLVAE